MVVQSHVVIVGRFEFPTERLVRTGIDLLDNGIDVPFDFGFQITIPIGKGETIAGNEKNGTEEKKDHAGGHAKKDQESNPHEGQDDMDVGRLKKGHDRIKLDAGIKGRLEIATQLLPFRR